MKLKEFIDNLNKLIADDPEVLNLDVIFSIDDEGNGFNHINFSPSIGVFDDEGNGDFIDEPGNHDKKDINAICIN